MLFLYLYITLTHPHQQLSCTPTLHADKTTLSSFGLYFLTNRCISPEQVIHMVGGYTFIFTHLSKHQAGDYSKQACFCSLGWELVQPNPV